ELKDSAVQTRRLFGHELVIFRGQNGDVGVLHAYCPHRNMHLGMGKVVDNALECSFHGRRFNRHGQCIFTPYGDPKIGAKNQNWVVNEVNGAIFVWYDSQNGQPDWNVEPIPEIEDRRWTP